jgi:hypothetical protein
MSGLFADRNGPAQSEFDERHPDAFILMHSS